MHPSPSASGWPGVATCAPDQFRSAIKIRAHCPRLTHPCRGYRAIKHQAPRAPARTTCESLSLGFAAQCNAVSLVRPSAHSVSHPDDRLPRNSSDAAPTLNSVSAASRSPQKRYIALDTLINVTTSHHSSTIDRQRKCIVRDRGYPATRQRRTHWTNSQQPSSPEAERIAKVAISNL